MRKKQLAVFLAIVLIGAIGLSFVPVSGVSVTSTGNRLSISTDVVLASKPAVDTESTGTPAVSKLPSTESSPVSYSPDTETLRPNAAGDECNIPGEVGAACPNHWQNVNETPSDEATSYVWNTVQTVYYRDFYNITNSTSSGTISNITVYARAYGQVLVNQASLKIVIKSGTGSGAPDTISESAEKTVTTLWANYSEVWATNNATSSAWTWDEVDNLQIGVSIRRCWFEQPAATRVTQVYVNVDYGNATAPAINNTPSSYDFGTVETSTTLATGLTVFNVTNTGDVPVNISISGTNMTGGTQWTLNDTATPGADIYGLKAGLSDEVKKYEYYNTGDDQSMTSHDVSWVAQTFMPPIAHKATSIKLLLYKATNPGTVTLSIRRTNGDGKPTGEDLCSGTTDGNTLTTDTAGEWREITLGDGYDLDADTQYAFVGRSIGYLYYRFDYSSPAYAGGTHYSSADSGVNWTYWDEDLMFEEWGVLDYDTTVKLNSPYNNLCTNLTVNATKSWGLKLYTPTSFSDGYEKTGTVTLTATEA